MQLPGKYFLAAAGFPLNQNGGLGPPNVSHQRLDFLHARAFRDQSALLAAAAFTGSTCVTVSLLSRALLIAF